ncbi:uncharacterized protein BP5553_10485 [Venustampulla echinocandica]|uniref:Uncharacterized protein n=1 Tax=Venustampulla echinocandica TaxID=2656787 RepID=A0A370T9F3_9HELO|nr:uncharacterized protein BP5553_10485 [Venustampulla echinocandica]RDL30207.1 hypothetical protein BP5553_10485 [Venustampulla echinocandica]
MLQIIFAAWMLFVYHGLTLATLVPVPEPAHSSLTRTSALPEVTVEIGSEHLNFSVIVQLSSLACSSCVAKQTSWNRSTAVPYQSSPLSSPNQTFDVTTPTPTKGRIVAISSWPSASATASLISDPNRPPASVNASTFIGSAFHPGSPGFLGLLLGGVLQLAIV